MTVYLDANCVIYLVELNPIWAPKLLARVSSLRSAGSRVAVGDLARTECLAQPFLKGNAAVIADFQAFFSSADVDVLPLTAAVCERAARIRAASLFQLKVPDCLHLATAIEHKCDIFLTNDVALRRCTQITVEILS
jgi:predicted nucleic acid-binding protein